MQVCVFWKYQSKSLTTSLTSDEMTMEKALLLIKDMEKTGRVKEIYAVDPNNNRWTKKEIEQYIKGIETEPHDVTAFFDGGFYKDTKKAGIGIVIYFKQNGKRKRFRKNALLEEITSNNEAEYAALSYLLNELDFLGVHHQYLTIKGDSQVVLNQVEGDWPIYEEEFSRWLNRIDEKIAKLGLTIQYETISRKENKEADQLATQALDGTSIESQMDIEQ